MNLLLNPRFGLSQLLVHSVGCVWFPPAGCGHRLPPPAPGGSTLIAVGAPPAALVHRVCFLIQREGDAPPLHEECEAAAHGRK